MGVAVAVVPFALDATLGNTAFRLIGFFVGATLLAVGFTLTRHGQTGLPRSQATPGAVSDCPPGRAPELCQ